MAVVTGSKGFNGWVGFTSIPLPNADKFDITVTAIEILGYGTTAPPSAYILKKNKDEFHLESNNTDEAYRLGTLYPSYLWCIYYTASYVG